MGSLRRILVELLEGSLLAKSARRILSLIWWTFWGLIDEILEGADLD